MKKIMKKALSLVLALVMVLTLAPMTAKAADFVVNGTNTVAYDGNDPTEITWTATDNGVLTISFAEDVTSWQAVIYPTAEGYWSSSLVEASTYTGSKVAQIGVTKDVEYTIAIANTDYEAKNMVFTSLFEAGRVMPGAAASAAIDITSTLMTEQLGYGVSKYYKVTGNAGDEYELTVTGYGQVFLWNGTEDVEQTADYDDIGNMVWTMEGNIPASGEVVFKCVSAARMPSAFMLTYATEGVTPPSTSDNAYDNPEVVETLGTFNPELSASANYVYWYEWTTDLAGIIGLYAITEEAYTTVYTVVNADGESVDYRAAYGDTYTEVQLEEGDTIVFGICAYGEDTAELLAVFEEGGIIPEDEPLEELNYAEGWVPFTVGANQYDVDMFYPYTVYDFTPDQTGVYTITTTNALIGIVGSYYVDDTLLNSDVVKETTLTFTSTSVGQGCYIAIQSDDPMANIEIKKVAEAQENVMPTIYAGIEATPAAYTYTANINTLKRVNFIDDTVDKVYLGADGYYHLNSLTGPIVLINLGDKNSLNLFDAANLGRLNGVKEISGVTYKWDFNYLVRNYAGVSDGGTIYDFEKNEWSLGNGTHLYPLTAQLMEMLQAVGSNPSNGWYTETGVFGNKADAWMFACYYNEEVTTAAPIINIADIPAKDANEILGKLDDTPIVLNKDMLDVLIEANKTQPVKIVTQVANGAIEFRFEANTMGDKGLKEYSFAASVTNDYSTIKDVTVAASSIVLKIDFAHSGKLPGKAKVTIPVGDKIANGTVLYYYLINADGTLTYTGSCGAVVNGSVTVEQDHCSSYVLSTQAPAVAYAPVAPKTGDNMNIGLWMTIMMLGLAGVTVVLKKRVF